MQDLHIVLYVVLTFTIVCPISKCPKIQQDKNLSNFDKLRCQNNGNLKIYDFLQKLKRWSVSCYTDRLSANQIAGKPVRISCYIIIIITIMKCVVLEEK